MPTFRRFVNRKPKWEIIPYAPPAPSYLVTQDFDIDYTGAPPGWYNASSMNFYSTTAPLQGVASVLQTNSNASTYVGFAGQSDVWAFGAIQYNVATPFMYNALYLSDGANADPTAGGDYAGVGFWGNANLRIRGGGKDDFPAFVSTPGTTYYIWIHYIKGTGSNSSFEVYISTTTTKPGSPIYSYIDGTNIANFVQFGMGDFSGSFSPNKWDYIRVSTSVIGSSPT